MMDAYAMATGGPILHPKIEAIVVSAICPMSLSSRPVVVPATSRIVITPIGGIRARTVRLWQDGASGSLIEPGKRCVIQRAPHETSLVLLNQNLSYYQTLTHKLHWASSLFGNQSS